MTAPDLSLGLLQAIAVSPEFLITTARAMGISANEAAQAVFRSCRAMPDNPLAAKLYKRMTDAGYVDNGSE